MKKFRRWIQYVGLVLGGIILIYQIERSISLLLEKNLVIFSPIQIAFAFFAVGGAIFLQMFAWSSGMESLNVRLSIKDVMQGYLLSFLPRYIPGTIWGYIGRSEWLYQKYGVDYKVSNQGSVIETMAAIVANLIVINLPFWRDRLPIQFGLFLLPLILWYLFRWLARLRVPKVRYMNSVLKVMFPKFRLGPWIVSVALFILVWLLYGLGLSLVIESFSAVPQTIRIEDILNFSYIYSAAWLFGFIIIFAPAGLGFREMALSNLLVIQMGISYGYGSILAILFRIIILLSEVILLGFSVILKTGVRQKQTKSI